MKKIIALAAATAALASVSGAAHAAPWQGHYRLIAADMQSFNQREARLEMQIRRGLRSGALTRAEAARLQNRLNSIERLERYFHRNGLTMAERRMLDNRLDSLARNIRLQLADNQHRGGHGVNIF